MTSKLPTRVESAAAIAKDGDEEQQDSKVDSKTYADDTGCGCDENIVRHFGILKSTSV